MDRPGFKPGGRRQALPGGFDSHSPPPFFEAGMIVCGLDFPDALYYLIEHQVWARVQEDGSATVGVTAMGIAQAGEIYMCRLRPMGSEVEQGRSIAVVELAKSIVSVKSPVGGCVAEINLRLAEEPELVHRDPYGEGWLARVRLRDFGADRAQLLHGGEARASIEHYAWLNGVG